MPSSGIIIPIRAIADLSGVSTAFNRLFGGSNSRALRDYQRDMDRLRQSLSATGQLGKNISRVMFDPSANRAELQTLTRIRQELEAIARTRQGRQWRASVIGSGQDWNKPWTWNYGAMGSNGAALQRHMAQGGAGGAPGPMGAVGAWGMGAARQGIGTMASLAGIGTVMGAVLTGYREHLATLEGVDAVFKSIGNAGGFKDLMTDTRALGKALQMTGSEASHLVQRFVQASGAISATDAYDQAKFAGQYGRGLGINPNASADLMARSSLLGYSSTKQSQREFAITIGSTISGSGMQARSEQVMGKLVEQIEHIATTQGRTASKGEMENYAEMLKVMFKDPALRGGGADTILGIGKRLGGEGGAMEESLAQMAYGPAVAGRIEDILRIQQADENTPLREIRGLGPIAEGYGDKTRADLAMGAAERYGDGVPGGVTYLLSKLMGMGTMQQIDVYRDQYYARERSRNTQGTQGYKDWMANEVGTSYQAANASGFGITTDIYENRGKLDRAHLDRLTGLANEYQTGDLLAGDQNKDLRDQLAAAMEPGDAATKMPQLQAIIAKIAARVGAPKTMADETRQSSADLVNLLGNMGEAVGTATNAIRTFATTVLGVTLPDENPQTSESQRLMDEQVMAGLQRGGYVDASGSRVKMDNGQYKPFATPYDETQYYRIHRQGGSGGGDGNWTPSWRDQTTSGDGAPSGVPIEASGPAPAGSSGGPNSSNPTGHTPDWMRNAENNGVSGSITPGRRALLDMVGRAESNGKYNAMYKSANQTQIDLTNMSMGDIDALQTRMIRERGGSVIGKYQFKQETLRGLRAEQGIGDDEKFDKAMQDRLGLALLKRRGLDEWEAGTLPDADFQRNLGHEWAGLPVDASGRSAYQGYNGNAATISNTEVVATLEAARTANNALPAAPPDSEPDVPATVADVDDEIPAVPANVDTETPAVPVADVPSAAPTVGNGSLTEEDFQARYAARERERQAQQGEIGRGGTQVDGVGGGANWDDVARMRPRNPLDTAQPPRTPPEVATPAGSTQASAASVNGSVAVNINVAKDGRPVETSAHQLSFGGQPQVAGSAGSQPSRVEWSRTV